MTPIDAVEREIRDGYRVEGLILAADALIEAGQRIASSDDAAKIVMDLIHKRRPSMFPVEFPS